MKAALDATPLTVATGGIRRYVLELTQALVGQFPQDEYWYFSDQPLCTAPAGVRVGAAPTDALNRRWWLLGVSRELRRRAIDVFHGTDFSVPYLPGTPSVMTLHDLSAWRGFDASERVRTRTRMLLRMRIPRLVITPSEAVRKEAIAEFGWPEERIVAVPLAAAAWLRPPGGGSKASPTPYFLYLGTLEARKNIASLVEAWRALPRGSCRLVLAGRARPGFAAPAPGDGLEVLNAVRDSELAQLYAGSIASLYLSEYEGFGLPVIEAMQCSAAVIASNQAAIAETAGGAAMLVDPHDVRAVSGAMQAVMENAALRAALVEKGLRRAAEFSWERTARETRAVYERAMRGSVGNP